MEYIVSLIVGAILQWLASLGIRIYRQQKDRADNEKSSTDSVQKLKDAKTAKEVDSAIDSALDGF